MSDSDNEGDLSPKDIWEEEHPGFSNIDLIRNMRAAEEYPHEVDEEALYLKDVSKEGGKEHQGNIPINKEENDGAHVVTGYPDAAKVAAIDYSKGGIAAKVDDAVAVEATGVLSTGNTVGNISNTPANHSATHAPMAPYVTASPTLNASVFHVPHRIAGKNPITSGKISTEIYSLNNPDKFPKDTYSFLVLNGPDDDWSWPTEKLFNFAFGLVPFILQMTLICLLLRSSIDVKRGTVGENDNPDAEIDGAWSVSGFLPSNANSVVMWTQLVSILSYVIYPDASLQDILKAVEIYPRSSLVQSGDAVGCMRFSCLLRGIQGFSAMFATLLLVLTSNSVVDIILNFTAMTYISRLDDYAFDLAMDGHYGPFFRAEAVKIANRDLPDCMHRKEASKWKCTKIVSGLVVLILFGVMILVLLAQGSNRLWVTKILRVQFQDQSLNAYSGCFELNKSKKNWFHRRVYDSVDDGTTNTSFGYCRDERQWILFEGYEDHLDPCDAKKEERELARSSKTDTFDISALFDESWVTSSNSPLDLYFFDDETKLTQLKEKQCGLSLGDGTCDPPFNKRSYQYDDGDCCAATCTGLKCGTEDLANIFGNDSSPAQVGFPNCKDPVMVPITIQFDHIVSSRNEKYFKSEGGSAPWDPVNDTEAETKWRTKKPVNPYFALDCNGKNVLTLYVEQSMAKADILETVMVEDGASCILEVRNTTAVGIPDTEKDDPILYINYTIFQGMDNDRMELLSKSSIVNDKENFKRIPECYLRKFENITDIVSMYTTSGSSNDGSSNDAIDWLLYDDKETSQCEDDDFIDRYAIITSFFEFNEISDDAANTTTEAQTTFLSSKLLTSSDFHRQKHCAWEMITCSAGNVTKIDLSGTGLKGDIQFPRAIKELTSLKEIQFVNNDIEVLPKEIGWMTSLITLDLAGNNLGALPTEIGLMTSLETLYLLNNDIEVLPTEIGLMTSLITLDLGSNNINTIPSEIGLLKKLETLDLFNNDIVVIPTEIGLMRSLITLDLGSNNINTIPSEIGLLKNLETLDLSANYNFNKIEIENIPDEVLRLCRKNTTSCSGVKSQSPSNSISTRR